MSFSLALALLAPLIATDTVDSWATLDCELAQLSTAVATTQQGVGLSGHFRSYYTHDDSHVPGSGGVPDKAANPNFSAFELESVRLRFEGGVEDISVAVSLDLETSTAVLVDAYARWAATPELNLTFGRFKQTLLNSQQIDESRLLFVKRTANAANLVRAEGLMVSGTFADKRGMWSGTVDNGADGVSQDREYIGRLTYDLVGAGAFGVFEGGVLTDEDSANASIGLAYADDRDVALGGRRTALELAGNAHGISVHADLIDHSDGYGGVDGTTGSALAGTTPNSVTVSYMVREDVELGWRFENFQDPSDTRRRSLIVNYYQVLPHRVKWSLSYEDTGSDDLNVEERIFRAGLTLAF